MTRHWLMKSEPGTYSIEDLEREGRTHWDGVRNYQARNHMREMEKGDLVLFYHSGTSAPAVVGLARVTGEAVPDSSALQAGSAGYDPRATVDDPRWSMVEIAFVHAFARPVSLADLRQAEGLQEMVVTRRSRLSVQPVRTREYEIVLRLAGALDEVNKGL
jgi:predicted RNA-binding protein with PUA-like domain